MIYYSMIVKLFQEIVNFLIQNDWIIKRVSLSVKILFLKNLDPQFSWYLTQGKGGAVAQSVERMSPGEIVG